jgi:hypothetical protein
MAESILFLHTSVVSVLTFVMVFYYFERTNEHIRLVKDHHNQILKLVDEKWDKMFEHILDVFEKIDTLNKIV